MGGQVKLNLEVENVDEVDLNIYRSDGLLANEKAMPDKENDTKKNQINFDPAFIEMVYIFLGYSI